MIYFNPHSPRRLWRQGNDLWPDCDGFQSTQSSQTVTFHPVRFPIRLPYFNPHSPRRLWPLDISGATTRDNISIHTVLADCDPVLHQRHHMPLISIHTVLADCDDYGDVIEPADYNFNPHSPRRLWLQLCMIFTIKYNLPSYTMHKSLFILYYIFSRNQILCALFWCESPRHFMFAWDSHHNTCIPFFW